MFVRRFRFAWFATPLVLSGCVAATRAPGTSPAPASASSSQLVGSRKVRQGREFDSLERSLHRLDGATLSAAIARWNAAPARPGSVAPRPAFLPSPAATNATWGTTTAPVLLPLVSRGLAGDLGFTTLASLALKPSSSESKGQTPVRFEAPRTLIAAAPVVGEAPDAQVRAFLSGWAARQSLARADEEFLGRRALGERIALQSRATLPEINLSLVPPDVQQELTNLRLQLIPLVAAPPAQKAQAQARIDAINARLRQIWEGETARQAQLRREALQDIPARLGSEGEVALRNQTLKQAQIDLERRAEIERDLSARLQPVALPALELRQEAALAPDPDQVRAFVQTPFSPRPRSSSTLAPLPVDNTPLSSVRTTSALGLQPRLAASATQQERLWRAATR